MIIAKNKIIVILALFILAFGLIFISRPYIFKIDNDINEEINLTEEYEKSLLSGLPCADSDRRPLAVVLAEDPAARPLFGISQADLIIEMPVITGSITRILAFYLCSLPEKIGPLRSARHDFIPLALGLDAILIHWGGSHFALGDLNAGIIDNLDALENPYNVFYRESSRPSPHNGFTSRERILNSIQKIGYRLENNFIGYPYEDKIIEISHLAEENKIEIEYSWPYQVQWEYQPENNSYLRWRAGLPEIDGNNEKQVEAKNIIVMKVFSQQIENDYNDLDLEGCGECQLYQNGQVTDCSWQKSEKEPASKLEFLNKNGQEIKFVPGQTWIEIIEP
jgi:hypothetical protein